MRTIMLLKVFYFSDTHIEKLLVAHRHSNGSYVVFIFIELFLRPQLTIEIEQLIFISFEIGHFPN